MKFSNPKNLLLLDGLGALLSVLLLGVVLVKFEWFFGIPKNVLYFLATLPCFFAFYDFFCVFKIQKKLGIFLKGIAIANLAYCILSIGLAIYHKQHLTAYGWGYVALETIVLIILASVELHVAKATILNSNI